MKRREFMKRSRMSALAVGAAAEVPGEDTSRSGSPQHAEGNGRFWPDGVRLVVSISMQLEAGAQAERGAESPFPSIDPHYPDLPVGKWYEYGF